MPSLANQTNQQADVLIKNAGLKPEAVSRSGVDCTPNQVVSQDPAAGSRVDEGSTVRYEWCAGPGKVVVPNLADRAQADAEAQLRNLKLDPKSEEVNSEKAKGTVVGTSPAAGAEVAEGTTVTLQVSKGNLKLVPGVANKGYSEGEAKAVLGNAGFPADRVEVIKASTTNPAQDGKVIFQSPSEGTPKDPATTTITLTVGLYNNPTPSNSRRRPAKRLTGGIRRKRRPGGPRPPRRVRAPGRARPYSPGWRASWRA